LTIPERERGTRSFGNHGTILQLLPLVPQVQIVCHPLLTSLDFDIDGSLVIGIMDDRHGDQIGPYNHLPIAGEPVFTVEAAAFGDILRACPSGNGETFVIEDSPVCEQNARPAKED